MRFHADLHVHSKYSRACSRDADLEHLAWWAGRKGVALLGTGDVTHPAWAEQIRDGLVPAEPGLYRLRPDLERDVLRRRVSGLDRYRLVSNSDAHSPPALGREATVFDTDLDYGAIAAALRTGTGFAGTIEFFPEEGRYHLDGHRGCDVRLDPVRTRERGGRCPVCDKPVTVGVLHRVDMLADHPAGRRPPGAAPFRCLVQLPQIVGEIRGVGARSKTVDADVAGLVDRLGPELGILQHVPLGDIARVGTAVLAEAIGRLRRGEVFRDAGYDGVYGVIRLFDPKELADLRAAPGLFEVEPAPALFAIRAPAGAPPEGTRAGETTTGPVASAGVASAAGLRCAAAGAAGGRPAAAAGPVPRTTEEMRAGAGVPGAAVSAASGGGLVAGLDPDQQAAFGILSGPLLVVAGPGTGKTRTLTHRIAHLVTAHGAAPEQCLAITFTRRAAEEMRSRLATLLPGRADRILVATFHALGLRIVREQADRCGLSPRFRVADEVDRLTLLREAFGDAGAGGRERRRLLGEVSRLVRSGITPPQSAPAQPHRTRPAAGTLAAGSLAARRAGAPPGAAEPAAAQAPATGPVPKVDGDLLGALARYRAGKRARDMVDLDDLITLPVALLSADPELAESYRSRWRWVSVDEYQDVDEAQYRLLRLLCPPEGNLCAIGDPDQAIYGFRGADVGFFLRFRTDYPAASTVALTRNYRSSPTIVRAALQAVAPSTLVPDRVLLAAAPPADGPARIILHIAADERAEAGYVVAAIDRILGGSSFLAHDRSRIEAGHQAVHSFADIAVLYRTSAQSAALADAFDAEGIPYQRRSHHRLSERPGVRDVLAVLREQTTASGPDSPPRPVLTRLRTAGQAALDAAGGIFTLAGADPGSRPERSADTTLPVGRIRAALELLTPLATAAGTDLDQFLNEVTLGAEVDGWDPRADRVALLTLHAAMGLEFPVVFIVGCEDDLLPLRFGGRDAVRAGGAAAPGGEPDADADADPAGSLAEERRLFFVGITRARGRLVLTAAARRRWHGQVRDGRLSRFVADIDPSLLDRTESTERRRPAQLRLL